MPPQRPSFRSTLDALTQAFADTLLLTICRATLAELAGSPEPTSANYALVASSTPGPAAQARRRPKAAPSRAPAPSSRPRKASAGTLPPPQLELPLDRPEYPETVIVDPTGILGAALAVAPLGTTEEGAPVATSQTVGTPVRLPSRPAKRTRRATLAASGGGNDGQVARDDQRASPDPVPREGEELLRGHGGGAVLRRRKPPAPPAPTGTEE